MPKSFNPHHPHYFKLHHVWWWQQWSTIDSDWWWADVDDWAKGGLRQPMINSWWWPLVVDKWLTIMGEWQWSSAMWEELVVTLWVCLYKRLKICILNLKWAFVKKLWRIKVAKQSFRFKKHLFNLPKCLTKQTL